ncbi:MAG TPA: sugar kinase [Candidatus Angelobacter sp.]|jgi:sugar/nucleoside kinase (ribokinase family)|nr:sugar kinase [Candidatus Angelobacter sp.]
MAGVMRAITLGAHVLDVLARPVEGIPEGQGGALLDQIRVAPAGTAAGTAVILAKLGANVRSIGAVGDDPLGDMLLSLLQRHGVDTALVRRRAEVQTSASVLPIRGDGSRPALHVIGANATLTAGDVPLSALDGTTHLHVGAPELLDPQLVVSVLRAARERGATTSVDMLAPGDFPGILDLVAAALPYVDHLLPNDEQVLGFTGSDDVVEGCRKLLAMGVGCVAATCGADGAIVVTNDGVERVRAFPVEVVDTSGCGDAFSAGYLRGLSLGRSLRDAAVLGCATAALVAQGLGTDHGEYDLAAVEEFATARAGA